MTHAASPTRTTASRFYLAIMTLLVFDAGACSDSNVSGEAPDASTAEHVYALATGVCGPDSCQTYLGTTTSLEPRNVDVREHGIELEGFVYPFTHGNTILVPGGEAPTLTRYTVDETGTLQAGATLSFAGVGFTGNITAGRARILSEDKAYAFDESDGVIFVWNPSAMTLTGKEIDISLIRRDGQDAFVAACENGARQRGDLLFVPVGWSDSTTYEVRPVAGMLVIDTVRDEVVKLVEDDRCTDLESSVVSAEGDMYFGFPAAATMLDVNARDPSFPACSLRIRAGETDFDPNYFLNISEATGGRIGCCAASGGGSTVYLQVLHEERTGITDRVELFGSAHNDWRFWRLDLESGQAEEVTSFPWFATSGVGAFETAEGVFRPTLTLAGDSGGLFSNVARATALVDLTSHADPKPTITVDGNLLFFARLR